MYAYLDSVLAENMNLTLGNSETPRAADAILFAHVLEARNIPKISDLVRSYSSVNKAVFFLLQKYFSSDEYGDLNGGLLKNACARLDSEVFATLSKAKVNLSNIPTSKQVFCADKNCEAASARCQQSTFLLDFSIQNFIPWRSQGYEPMNGNLSVIFNLRSALFTSVVASSFFVYLLKAYQS